nr:hypothetical protein [Rubripirellula sp.]
MRIHLQQDSRASMTTKSGGNIGSPSQKKGTETHAPFAHKAIVSRLPLTTMPMAHSLFSTPVSFLI